MPGLVCVILGMPISTTLRGALVNKKMIFYLVILANWCSMLLNRMYYMVLTEKWLQLSNVMVCR